MFNDKPYMEVNREERFFCGLLFHALLVSPSVRREFCKLVQSKAGVSLDPDNLEIFLEVAALRDYWYDLGNALSYKEETHRKRKMVVESILKDKELPPGIMQKHPFFWTTAKQQKLSYPGRWNEDKIKEAKLDRLIGVKWAFNAKPDMLITSDKNALVIEAKVESGEGRNGGTGYSQIPTQKDIAYLLKLLVPQFRNSTIKNITLTPDPKSGLTWKDLTPVCDTVELDSFTRRALAQLNRF